MTLPSVTLPIRTVSEANVRQCWQQRSRRVRAQRDTVGIALRLRWGAVQVVRPIVVTLTRSSPGVLDDDNLRGALKAVRDAIAEHLGVDDRHAYRVRYEYLQRRGPKGHYAVRIDVEDAT